MFQTHYFDYFLRGGWYNNGERVKYGNGGSDFISNQLFWVRVLSLEVNLCHIHTCRFVGFLTTLSQVMITIH